MKKLFLSLNTVIFCALSVFAQTPYDNFAPEQRVKSMIELPEMQFKVTNTDPNSEIRHIEFDKNTLSLSLVNDNDSVLETIMLNPNDKKFLTIDPLAEKYPWMSPYAYCANNPVRYIDPTGMYFDEANEKRAQKMEKSLDKQISKLEKQVAKIERKGGDVGDLNDRITDLKSSKSDISDMRSNESTEFRYAKASDKNNPAGRGLPVTSATGANDAGHNVVTMYTEGNMGNQIHESRHGGQIARGEYSFDQRGNPTAGYGIGSEMSAYRAQYSYDGKLNYIDASSALNQQFGSTGITPPASTVTNILTITPDFVRTKIGEVRSAVIRGNRIYGLAPIYGRLP